MPVQAKGNVNVLADLYPIGEGNISGKIIIAR